MNIQSTVRLAGLAAILLLAGCVTTPEVDPVQLRLDDLDGRISRIDRILANQSLIQMSQRIDSQQEEIRILRGRLEELQNENAGLRKEQRDLYADLDRRLGETAATAAAAAATAAASHQNQPEPAEAADEQSLYDRAFELLKARDYAAASEGFRSLAAMYPEGQLADNTQYWLGETYYVTQEYDHAAAAFQRVLTNWPDGRKAPDAMLKLGYTQLEQGKRDLGRATLEQVVSRYPSSDPARQAADRLAKLPR